MIGNQAYRQSIKEVTLQINATLKQRTINNTRQGTTATLQIPPKSFC